jgi:hypothetical protein
VCSTALLGLATPGRWPQAWQLRSAVQASRVPQRRAPKRLPLALKVA